MGVVEGFEAWYLGMHPRVISFVLVACGDADVAADSADEAFTRALDRWGQVGAMESPGGWVCRVALNVMRRRMRRRSMEQGLIGRQPARSVPGEPVWCMWSCRRRYVACRSDNASRSFGVMSLILPKRTSLWPWVSPGERCRPR
jgi:hypothetical protein